MKSKIFVINLERCINKRNRMKERLKNESYQLWKAIDGRELNEEKLKEMKCDILKEWKDPYSGRNITLGEVGCALSHYKIYEYCVKNNIENAVILEDDVLIPNDFGEKISTILEKLAHIDWEFCYLGRKSMDNKDVPYNEIFVKSGYSYWTCSYIINLKGMKKIIKSGMKNNLIAQDEVLPIIGKVSPHKNFYKYYNIDEPLKMYSLKNLICKPEPSAFLNSDTENTKEIILPTLELIILTTGTDMTDGLKRFIKSCNVYGLSYIIMGLGDKWNGGDMSKGPGGGQKICYLINYIKHFNPEQLILVSDSYDVIMTANSKEIIKKFNEFNKPIVFASEPNCWPDKSLANKYPNVNSDNKYLNSGGFIGKVKDILKILPETFESHSDDQLYYTKQFLNTSLIELDYKCKIFQCLNKAENNIEILYNKSRVKNKITETLPCQIHGNGDNSRKLYLNKLGNYLSRNWTDIWGYNKKNMLLELPKSINILIYIETNAEKHEIYEDLRNIINENINVIKEKSIVNIFKYSTNKFFSENTIGNKSVEKNRNNALKLALQKNVDYFWFIDSIYVITNKYVLRNMILQNKGIVGPFLNKKGKLWSNFWGDIDNGGWYKTSFDYHDIVNRERKGCWNIAHLAGNYLINKDSILKVQNFYTNNYNKYYDSDMKFSKNCRDNNIFLYVDNMDYYGYIYEEIKDEIPTNAIHKNFYLFETNKDNWAKTYFHPEFYNSINKWNKLKIKEICPYAFEFPLMNNLFCEHLLDEVNNINEWSSGGHKEIKDSRIGGIEYHPTVDIHIKKIGFRKQWEEIIHTYIAPLVSHLYSPYKTNGINIAFVVKYELGKQEYLKPHHDSSTYSLTLTLNRPNIDFEGGGTRFVKQDVTIQGKKGYCSIHPGKLTHYHEGLPITKGKRYIMVSFIN